MHINEMHVISSLSEWQSSNKNTSKSDILYDKGKSKNVRTKMHSEMAKLQELIKTGTILAAIASDVVRISGTKLL